MGFDSFPVQRIFLFSIEFCVPPVSYTTHTGVFVLGIQRPERDINHTALAINDVKSLGAVSPFIFTSSWHDA